MKTKFIFVIFFCLILFGFVEAVEIDSSIYESLENKDLTRVVIYKDTTKQNYLSSKFSTKSLWEDDNLGLSADQIKYNYEDYIVAFIDEEDLEKLQNNLYVKSIESEMIFHTLLQNATVIQNATSSWNLIKNGINLSGLGQTVCIIDTGINYSHNDFGNCYGNNNVSSNCKVIGGYDFCANNDSLCSGEDSNPMDIDGHGTHVSGIISANGSIIGISPGSKIIMIKVGGNPDGIIYLSDIQKGIRWCIDNSTKFNISIISMSLGANVYNDTYCDSIDDEMTNLISDAYNNNISVIIATGNNHTSFPNKISFPSCISYAIPVSASTKLEELAIYANRNSLVKLLGIGTSVNSTGISGTYELMSGTSMATPMVAGAIAIINQYLNLSNQTKTPWQIEDILYNHGKPIYDLSSNRNYSRIDLYSSLLSIDVDFPQVVQVEPENNSFLLNTSINFTINVSDWQLKNITFNLYNITDIVNTTSFNISGYENYSNINISGFALDNRYYWNYKIFDENNNSLETKNYTLYIGNQNVRQTFPKNYTFTNINETLFICNLSSNETTELSNVTFYLYNSSNEIIYSNSTSTSGKNNETTFNFTFNQEGEYNWQCILEDNESNIYESTNFSISYDISYPNISEVISLTTNDTVNISWIDTEPVNYSINISDNFTNSSDFIENNTVKIENLQNNTEYNFTIFYCDKASNCNITEIYTFKTNQTLFCGDGVCNNGESCSSCSSDCGRCPSSSSSGGGSSIPTVGSITNPVKLSSTPISKIYYINKKTFFQTTRKENHSLQINNIYNNTAEIEINSNPIILNLTLGNSTKLNISNDVYYDLLIVLNSISKNNANITIKEINELISKLEENKTIEKNETIKNVQEHKEININNNYLKIIVSVVLLILILLIILKNGTKKDKNTKIKAFLERKS